MKKRLFLIALVFAFLAACSNQPEAIELPTATVDQPATEEAQAAATQAAEETAEAAQTPTKAAEQTATAEYRATQKEEAAIAQVTKEYERAVAATEKAQPMYDMAVTMLDAGYLTSVAGELDDVKDFTWAWAQLNWFQGFPVGEDVEDFILHTEIEYETASDTSDWYSTGCGVMFRLVDNNNYYVAFMTLDGNMQLMRVKNGGLTQITKKYWGKADTPSGTGSMTIAMQGPKLTIYINGEFIVTLNENNFAEGELAYSILSGTNAGFGTRCSFEDTQLWHLDPTE